MGAESPIYARLLLEWWGVNLKKRKKSVVIRNIFLTLWRQSKAVYVWLYLPAPNVLYKKFQQDTRDEIPQEVLYWGRLTQYLKEKTSNISVTQSWLTYVTNLNLLLHVPCDYNATLYWMIFRYLCYNKKVNKKPKTTLKTKIKQTC